MPERPSRPSEHLAPEQPEPSSKEHEQHTRFNLSTITGIKVDSVEVPKESEEIAQAYLAQLSKDKTNAASKAELAFAFRRQLQEDLAEKGLRRLTERIHEAYVKKV